MKQLYALSMLVILCQFVLAKASFIVKLKGKNWLECLEGEWMIKFCVPWSPECRNNKPEFEKFFNLSKPYNIKVAMVDVSSAVDVSGRFILSKFPTFYHALNGEFRLYTKEQSSGAMINYIKTQAWKNDVPLEWLYHPTSPLMTVSSWLQQVYLVLVNINEALMKKYGFNSWKICSIPIACVMTGGVIVGLFASFLCDVVFTICSSKLVLSVDPKDDRMQTEMNGEIEEKEMKEKFESEAVIKDTNVEESGSNVEVDIEVCFHDKKVECDCIYDSQQALESDLSDGDIIQKRNAPITNNIEAGDGFWSDVFHGAEY